MDRMSIRFVLFGNTCSGKSSAGQILRIDPDTLEWERVAGGLRNSYDLAFHHDGSLFTYDADMDIMHREIFGPVIVVNEICDLDEGITLANASDYGLSSSIFTRSLSSAMKAISELRFGETYVNREHFEAIQGFHAGVRKSGIGGTDGKHGLYEYTHTQVAYIQT